MALHVKNITNSWKHAMKRVIPPMGTIPVKELHLQYGKKVGIRNGLEFVSWLKEHKLKDTTSWEVIKIEPPEVKRPPVFGEEGYVNPERERYKEPELDDLDKEAEDAATADDPYVPRNVHTEGNFVPMVKIETKIEDIVNLKSADILSTLKDIDDVVLLKYALSDATKRPKKETLCRALRKRIRELNAKSHTQAG